MPEKLAAIEDSAASLAQNYKVVTWDLDTTGRKLVDEICQIGGYCHHLTSTPTFSQYVMPHRNPNPGARLSFGIKVVSIGRYRMLKDAATGQVLKTKSEVAALQAFIAWLEEAAGGGVRGDECGGIILVSHEQERQVLAPLLIQALDKYQLLHTFSRVVRGFVTATDVIAALADKSRISSLSLRSLCKTVLSDTSLPTTSATDRCKRTLEILSSITSGSGGVEAAHLLPFLKPVAAEQEVLATMKQVLAKQNTLRPIFYPHLNQSRLRRSRALCIRRHMAEAGLDFQTLHDAFSRGDLPSTLEKVKFEEGGGYSEEMLRIVSDHFANPHSGFHQAFY